MLILYLSYLETEEDREQFADIYYCHRKAMVLFAMTYCHCQQDAEDATENVFLRIAQKNWDTVQKISNKDDLRNYLLKSTKHACLNLIGAKNQDNLSLDNIPEELLNYNVNLSNEDFIKSITDRIEYTQVVESVKLLSDKYKDPLYYHIIMEHSVEETAVMLGQTVSTTKKQLVRGKKLLLGLLENQGVISHVDK